MSVRANHSPSTGAKRSNRTKRSIKVLLRSWTVLWALFGTPGPATAGVPVTNGRVNQCPVECACLGNVVDCSGLQLVVAPSGLPPWTEILELRDNNIANLETDALLHLTKLKELDVSANRLGDNISIPLSNMTQLRGLKVNKNNLSRVPNLTTLTNLTHLTLTRNMVENIDGTSLQNLPHLQNLDLSGNRISVLQRGSFLGPNHLTHLNLNVNQIGVIENGSLVNLTSLQELRLNRNRLDHLKDLFTDLGQLRVLELNRNELRQIESQSLMNLKNLQELRLKRNKIIKLDDGAFWPLKNLIILQLDHNSLSVVKKGGLFGLESLQKLSMSHNKITTIEPQAWEICQNITDLDLSYNELATIERGSFKFLGKLEKLKLDHNRITHIADGAFNNTPNLQILEMNHNEIFYVVEDMNRAFSPLGQLAKLGLAHNQIKSINENSFTGLAALIELDLTGNNITSILENAFIFMPNLAKLKMNSSALVCDCRLQWLSVWLHEHRFTDARLRCGFPDYLHNKPLTHLHHANFTCDEYPKPLIIEEPDSQRSLKGDNVTLVCRARSTANATLRFTWTHNNKELNNFIVQSESGSSDKRVTEALSILPLVNITHNYDGMYQCKVTNTYGNTYSAKAKITVLTYPSFSKIPHDIRVTAGSTARLECSADGLPAPQIAWQKDGGNDFPAARERRMHMMPTDDVLFIINAKTADSGLYTCTAQNLAGLIVANATITILETPSFVKPMENKEIIAGGSIVMECMASGSPRPKLSWRKNGSPLQATERHFFTAEDQLLIIVDTIESDAGNYTCEMSNSLGTVVGASHLTINPASSSMVNEDDMLGIIIITVVCCAVGTSVVWVVIIYQTRRRLNATHNKTGQLVVTSTLVGPETQTHLFLDTSSQHSKDSGTGDSTNPSSDQLQLCLPEEIVTYAVNEEETGGDDPLLRYTNHERSELSETDSIT